MTPNAQAKFIAPLASNADRHAEDKSTSTAVTHSVRSRRLHPGVLLTSHHSPEEIHGCGVRDTGDDTGGRCSARPRCLGAAEAGVKGEEGAGAETTVHRADCDDVGMEE